MGQSVLTAQEPPNFEGSRLKHRVQEEDSIRSPWFQAADTLKRGVTGSSSCFRR